MSEEQLNRIESLLVGFIEQTNQKFESVDRRFESIDRRFDTVDQRFDAVDQRLDAVDRRFDAVDQRLDTVDRRFDTVDQRFDSMQSQLDRIEQSSNEDLIAMLMLTHTKIEEVKSLAEHTLKEQALMKYELSRLKPSFLSHSNNIYVNENE